MATTSESLNTKHNELVQSVLALFFENKVLNTNNITDLLNRFNIDIHYYHELLLATAIASENYYGIRILLKLGAEPNNIHDDICKYELDSGYVLMVNGICKSYGKSFDINIIKALE